MYVPNAIACLLPLKKQSGSMILSFRKALLLYMLLPIVVIFILFSAININTTIERSRKTIDSQMTTLAMLYGHKFNEFLKTTSATAKIMAATLTINPDLTEQELYQLLEQNLKNQELAYGLAIAYVPYQFDPKRKLFSPYVYRQDNKIIRKEISGEAYDYTQPQWEWWHKPLASGKGEWTEPYFDKGAGNIMMSTYSIPFYKQGKIRGVVTIDIPLNQLYKEFDITEIKKDKLGVISSSGMVILSPRENEIGMPVSTIVEKTHEAAVELFGKEHADAVRKEMWSMINKMQAGGKGKIVTKGFHSLRDHWFFYAPIQAAGWSFIISIEENEAFAHVYKVFWYSIGYFGLLLLFLIISVTLVSGKFSRSLELLISRCQQIERMDFQPGRETAFDFDEGRQLSNTLDRMSSALAAHFSIKDDVRIARAIREQCLPGVIPGINGYQIEIWSRSTDERGDEIYDVVEVPESEHVGLLLIKDYATGIDASVKNVQLRTIFRTALRQRLSPEKIARYMNYYLLLDAPLKGPVQVWFGLLNAAKNCLQSLSLGQYSIIHFLSFSQSTQVHAGNLIFLATQKQFPVLHQYEIEIASEDIILIASEGVTMALNKKREAYSLTRVEELIRENCQQTAAKILEIIKADFLNFTEGSYIQTDCSIIIIKRDSQNMIASF
jgi:sulfur transfer complex TusBCD TusB component (DsrH family)